MKKEEVVLKKFLCLCMTVLLIITLSGCSGQKEQRVYTKEKPLVLRLALVDVKRLVTIKVPRKFQKEFMIRPTGESKLMLFLAGH